MAPTERGTIADYNCSLPMAPTERGKIADYNCSLPTAPTERGINTYYIPMTPTRWGTVKYSDALPGILGNRAFISGEQGNKCQILMGTGEQRQY